MAFTGATKAAAASLLLAGLSLLVLLVVVRPQVAVSAVAQQGSPTVRKLFGEEEAGICVQVTGDQHMETSKWLKDDSGIWSKQRILRRPGWQKTSRCALDVSGGEICEECWGSTDCWAPSGSTTHAVGSSGGSWTRFVSTIHVRCSAPTIAINYEVLNVQQGHLRFLWDNVEIFQHSGVEGSSGSAVIDMEHRGGHTFEVEFVAHAGASAGAAGAELSKLELEMPESYAECEDFKACLDPLAMNENTVMLRSSNALQLACLENPTTEECVMWQYCLVASDRREAILALLRAGGVGTVTLPGSDGRRLQIASTTEAATTAASTTEAATSGASTTEAATTVAGTTAVAATTAASSSTEAITTVASTTEVATTAASTTTEAATTAASTTEAATTAPSTTEAATTVASTTAVATTAASTTTEATTTIASTTEAATTAASTTEVATTASATREATPTSASTASCRNPLLEDVESWACDCYDEMQDRCEQFSAEAFYTRELCMRALICDHPSVCSDWKAAACSTVDPAFTLMQGLLQTQQRRLMERRLLERAMVHPTPAKVFLASQQEQEASFDRALSEKQCI